MGQRVDMDAEFARHVLGGVIAWYTPCLLGRGGATGHEAPTQSPTTAKIRTCVTRVRCVTYVRRIASPSSLERSVSRAASSLSQSGQSRTLFTASLWMSSSVKSAVVDDCCMLDSSLSGISILLIVREYGGYFLKSSPLALVNVEQVG